MVAAYGYQKYFGVGMVSTRTRRDFLFYATSATAAGLSGAALVGLTGSFAPPAKPTTPGVRVDFSDLEPGQQITIKFRGKPIFLRHRTEAEIIDARATPMNDLIDTFNRHSSAVSLMPRSFRSPLTEATDQSRSIDPDGKYVIFVGICTHLGCVPLGDRAGDFDGWFCPCHGSHFDASGRVRFGLILLKNSC